MRSTKRRILMALTCSALACEAGDGGIVGTTGESAVTGRVDQPTASYMEPTASPAATSAEVARVNADGSLTALAHSKLGTDGTYRIEGVMTGRSDLLVVARSATGGEVGRVLLAGLARTADGVVAAPIRAETTVHGLVYSELRAMGAGAGEISPAEIELLLGMASSTAAAVARSRSEVRALAQAYAEAQDTQTRAYARLGAALSARARQKILLTVQAEHHARLHGGASTGTSYESFVSAAATALADSGASAEAVVLATAGARAAADLQLAAGRTAHDVRAEVARASARLNLASRVRLLADVPEARARERSGTADILARARLRVRIAASAEQVEAALSDAEADARRLLRLEIGSMVVGLDADARASFEAALAAAFDAADLAVAIEGRTTPSIRAEALATYFRRVEAAAAECEARSPADARLDASATTRLILAARAG